MGSNYGSDKHQVGHLNGERGGEGVCVTVKLL